MRREPRLPMQDRVDVVLWIAAVMFVVLASVLGRLGINPPDIH